MLSCPGGGIRPDTMRNPFSEESQLNHDFETTSGQEPKASNLASLPGHPRIQLNDLPQLFDFLEREFCAPDLEKMAPHLWMVSTQSSANICPLHHEKVRGREIVVTEDPRLHLVWIHDRIFIKPIPRYLFSHAFWTHYLLNDKSPLGCRQEIIRRSALGYLRTYYHLIKHESDFHIARDDRLRLIPIQVDWAQFSNFTSQFDCIEDVDVSRRYAFGELRLTRLNFYAKIFLRKFQFQDVHSQYAAYFSRFYGPFLFIFGILSLVLNMMQVELSVEQVTTAKWGSFWSLCRWFSVLGIAWIGCLALMLSLLLIGMILNEWVYAIKVLRTKRRERRGESFG